VQCASSQSLAPSGRNLVSIPVHIFIVRNLNDLRLRSHTGSRVKEFLSCLNLNSTLKQWLVNLICFDCCFRYNFLSRRLSASRKWTWATRSDSLRSQPKFNHRQQFPRSTLVTSLCARPTSSWHLLRWCYE